MRFSLPALDVALFDAHVMMFYFLLRNLESIPRNLHDSFGPEYELIFLPFAGGQVQVQHLGQLISGPGALHRLQLVSFRVRRSGIRTRLFHDEPERSRVLGSAVRRLQQQRSMHHRSVLVLRADQVDSTIWVGHASSSWIGRDGEFMDAKRGFRDGELWTKGVGVFRDGNYGRKGL